MALHYLATRKRHHTKHSIRIQYLQNSDSHSSLYVHDCQQGIFVSWMIQLLLLPFPAVSPTFSAILGIILSFLEFSANFICVYKIELKVMNYVLVLKESFLILMNTCNFQSRPLIKWIDSHDQTIKKGQNPLQMWLKSSCKLFIVVKYRFSKACNTHLGLGSISAVGMLRCWRTYNYVDLCSYSPSANLGRKFKWYSLFT